MISGKNFIGNQLSANGTKTYKTFNPELNTENAIVFTEATAQEIDDAANLAASAFKEFRAVPGIKKATFLNAIANEILALDDVLVKTYCSETGLPEGRAKGERGRTIGQLQNFANLVAEGSWVEATIDTAQPNREPMPRSDIRKMLIPLGPVVVFGASNFPLAYSTAGGDTAAALASGCPVIVKSHPMHSGTGALVASAIIKAAEKTGMPNGVFSNLNSSGIEVGQQLVAHPKVKAVGFTGSIKGGRALFELASKRAEPIPVFAEMGSINPVIILPKALENRQAEIAKTYASSITLGTGQFCTNPGLLLGIKSDALTSFINNVSEEIIKINPSCMLHPNIKKGYVRNKEKVVSQDNVTVTANYRSDVQNNYATQAIVSVDGKTFLENSTLHLEVFGPFSMIVQCENISELETVIASLEGQLTGTVISDSNEVANYPAVITALQNRVGRIIFNGVPTGVEVCESMVHGGPYPASTDSRFTAVGIGSIKRWVRPFSYQDWPNDLLPNELKNNNPSNIFRVINGIRSKN
ncbi:aldehyde dehydrogenase (NADP(+)) [Cellulophaga lytica]|uniref:Aldehyde dehydrogenase (NADP(+)) n=1 Tax=Cellulophaga lytica (strain ATCC 23178 / DSM 7489 / JCM 8516 / NBRC 14961 / NCIMB 1423 / VKM B-1433 / Cy l20) TaxID=867900 RepID=F0REN5_CELLC|nr:aldehyde dehydrogenase (NADP(+)) [Cellulophaga lytica]ADY31050.1 Aldehyde dehydrogenase (NADP(+)) [Cellulophaga lytica DSM 7489]AIM62010.1 aldehyde dehydrogenase [Cellulophaga lytica]WQG78039.1 aldehyde dehydrogenase (NADP(+)) [Cellulophaga lytica]